MEEIMARNARQTKILELISDYEIEKQEELVQMLRQANFDITQATISRDIKELGLTKILSSNKKYKYAYVGSTEQNLNNKYINIFKEAVVSIKVLNTTVLIKTLKGIASAINSFIDKLGIENCLGSIYGDDTVTIYFETPQEAKIAQNDLNGILYQ